MELLIKTIIWRSLKTGFMNANQTTHDETNIATSQYDGPSFPVLVNQQVFALLIKQKPER